MQVLEALKRAIGRLWHNAERQLSAARDLLRTVGGANRAGEQSRGFDGEFSQLDRLAADSLSHFTAPQLPVVTGVHSKRLLQPTSLIHANWRYWQVLLRAAILTLLLTVVRLLVSAAATAMGRKPGKGKTKHGKPQGGARKAKPKRVIGDAHDVYEVRPLRALVCRQFTDRVV